MEPPEDAPATSETGQLTERGIAEKRKTKPDRVRTAVYAWLESLLQTNSGDWMRGWPDTWLAARYSRAVPPPPGNPGHVRKVIAAWRKERGLTRVSKPNG